MNRYCILMLVFLSTSFVYAGHHKNDYRSLSDEELLITVGGGGGGSMPGISTPKPKPIPNIKLSDVPYAGQYIWTSRNHKEERSEHYCGLACTAMIAEWAKTREGSRNTWVYNSSDSFYCLWDPDREDVLEEMDDDLYWGQLERKYGSGYVPSIDVEKTGLVVTSNSSDEDNFNDTRDALLALAYKFSTENVRSGYPEIGSLYIYPKPALGYFQYISYAATGEQYSDCMDFIADYIVNDKKPLIGIVNNGAYLHYILIVGVQNPDGDGDEREFYVLDTAENEYDSPEKVHIRKRTNGELYDWLVNSYKDRFAWVPDYLASYAGYEPRALLGYYAIWD